MRDPELAATGALDGSLSLAEDDESLSGLWLSYTAHAEMSSMGATDRTRAFYSGPVRRRI